MNDTEEVENKSKGEKGQILCTRCRVETEHLVIQSLDVSGSETISVEDPDDADQLIIVGDFDWGRSYQIIRCAGCKTVSFREESWESNTHSTEAKLYPMRSAATLTPKNYPAAPTALRRIYRETVDSFNNECVTLCAGGLRAIVEGICADKKIKDGPVEVEKDGVKTTKRSKSLDGKISGLREKGLLTAAKAKILHEHRYLGNDALHDLDMPSVLELKLAIDIIEHVLEELYTLEHKASELAVRRENREKGTIPPFTQIMKGKLNNPN